MENQRGFIALMSVIIISAILLVLVYTLEASSFFQRFDALDAENKRVSFGLAEACVNMAMRDGASPGVVTVDGTKKCTICLITPTIQTRAAYNNAYTNFSVTVDSDFAVTSWQETPTGPAGCSL